MAKTVIFPIGPSEILEYFEPTVIFTGLILLQSSTKAMVKELIYEVQNQKSIRNEANAKVKELKKVRLDRSNELKELREILRNNNNQRMVEEGEKTKGPSARKIRAARKSLEQKYEKGGFPGNKEKDFHNMMKKLQKELKEATDREEASNSNALKKVRSAEFLQTEAHKSVEKAVINAQDAHDLILIIVH